VDFQKEGKYVRTYIVSNLNTIYLLSIYRTVNYYGYTPRKSEINIRLQYQLR